MSYNTQESMIINSYVNLLIEWRSLKQRSRSISHRNKVLPQTLPIKLSLVVSKQYHISLQKYVENFFKKLSIIKAAKGPFMTSCSIEFSKVDELAPCNTHCMQQEIVCILKLWILDSNFPLADLKSCVSLLSSSANTPDSLENLGQNSEPKKLTLSLPYLE